MKRIEQQGLYLIINVNFITCNHATKIKYNMQPVAFVIYQAFHKFL